MGTALKKVGPRGPQEETFTFSRGDKNDETETKMNETTLHAPFVHN